MAVIVRRNVTLWHVSAAVFGIMISNSPALRRPCAGTVSGSHPRCGPTRRLVATGLQRRADAEAGRASIERTLMGNGNGFATVTRVRATAPG
ncbi:hypothetical protein [Actinoplanes flavus]|uniref:Secreted protein n=1 Tax=Actinoplanes flavus TaxID=2820290 RepID=A0ABS3UNK1_9ACTN|nr:hypothetical protein [Actinoplanes flavus]MBO3740364.1 hypothetical protein [Actinoplanes flavus]